MLENRTLRGSVFALLTTVIWSGNFVVARMAVGKISPMTLGAARWLVALLVLCCFALPRLKREWPVARKFLPQILVAGLTAVTLYNPLCYLGAATTSAINLALISVTTPIFIVIICSCWAKSRPSTPGWAAPSPWWDPSIWWPMANWGAWWACNSPSATSSHARRGHRLRGVQHRAAQGPRGAVPKPILTLMVFFG
jgi:uncharacterized membrane protein